MQSWSWSLLITVTLAPYESEACSRAKKKGAHTFTEVRDPERRLIGSSKSVKYYSQFMFNLSDLSPHQWLARLIN